MLLRRRSTTETPSNGSSTYLTEIFVISAAALLLEISYTRIISFKLYYYYTYLVIGLALLGLGSGAVIIAVSGRLRRLPTRTLLAGCTLAATIGVVVGYVAVAMTPLDTLAIWTGDTSIQLVAVGQLLVICLGLYVSFLPIGMCVSALFARRSDDINRLYFSDLAGAALACLVVVPLVATIGPVSIIAGVAIVLIAVGLHIGWTDDGIFSSRAVQAVGLVAGLLLIPIVLVPDTAPDIRTEESKGVRPDTDIQASEWSALFRVDASAFPDNTVLFHDGIWGSAIWPWDGDRPPSVDSIPTSARSRSPRSASHPNGC